jgi:small neutral amino acid transporter SnatA (MarC family)
MSQWLVAIALVAAVNPPRLAPALPRGDRPPRERVVVATTGAVLAAAALGGLVAVGTPVAGWLDVSAPTFAVAAGLVLAIAAIGQAARRPRPEPSLPGRRGALVPVAVPFVLRPEAGLVCLAAGAGDVALGAVVGLVGVVAGTTVAAWIDTQGVTGRTTRWAARLFEVAALTAGVAITVDGVIAV